MSQVLEVVVDDALVPNFPPTDLPAKDEIPLESDWHRGQMNVLIDSVMYRWRERQDFFAGGNTLVYFSMQQLRNRDYRGPDFFVVKEIDGTYPRQKGEVWAENGRYADVIIALMSLSTAREDLGPKKTLYERTFHTREYFCYDPDTDTDTLWCWRLGLTAYEPLYPDAYGRLWSVELDAWLGTWDRTYLQKLARWLRLFDVEEHLIPTEAEAERQRAEVAQQHAEELQQHAEAERQRADAGRSRAGASSGAAGATFS